MPPAVGIIDGEPKGISAVARTTAIFDSYRGRLVLPRVPRRRLL